MGGQGAGERGSRGQGAGGKTWERLAGIAESRNDGSRVVLSVAEILAVSAVCAVVTVHVLGRFACRSDLRVGIVRVLGRFANRPNILLISNAGWCGVTHETVKGVGRESLLEFMRTIRALRYIGDRFSLLTAWLLLIRSPIVLAQVPDRQIWDCSRFCFPMCGGTGGY